MEENLNTILITNLSYSLATFFKKGKILIGQDARLSSPIISRLVSSAVNSAGLDVWDAGIIPISCLQFATKRYRYSGGIMITACIILHSIMELNQ